MHPNVLMCFVNDNIYESKQVYSTKNNYLYNDESFHYSIDELYEQYDFRRDTNQKKKVNTAIFKCIKKNGKIGIKCKGSINVFHNLY